MKKRTAVTVFCLVMCMGCGKSNVMKTYERSEKDGVTMTYYELNDGTWRCDSTSYQFRLELSGKMPNAAQESCYIVLTDNENLTFEEVSKSQYSSQIEDSKIMEHSVIVEMR